MPEYVAITSSKSDVNPCSRGRETDHQKKSADGQTALQPCIVDTRKTKTCNMCTAYHIGHQPTSHLHKFPWYKALWRHTRPPGELPRPTPSMHIYTLLY